MGKEEGLGGSQVDQSPGEIEHAMVRKIHAAQPTAGYSIAPQKAAA
jgi:hypothetical protein